jgi:hypothetical protein
MLIKINIMIYRKFKKIILQIFRDISGPLTYTAKEPDSILIQPLAGGDSVMASKVKFTLGKYVLGERKGSLSNCSWIDASFSERDSLTRY